MNELLNDQAVKTLAGLIGLLGIYVLAMKAVVASKQVFGRVPPFNIELDKRDKALRKMIFASEANLKERIAAQDRRIEQLDEQYREMQIDRERKWAELKGEYSNLAQTLAYIRGKWDEEDKRRNHDAR